MNAPAARESADRDLPTANRVAASGRRIAGRRPGVTSLHLLPPPPPPLPPLPLALTSFVGRAAEIEEVAAALRQPTTRLLTLTGPGGVGKTRLAIEAACRLREDFPDGVGFVPLASVRDPDHVAATIAQHLGLRQADRRPPVQQIQRWLADRVCLLVVDNFEQVVAAAPLLVEVLASCLGLKLLITSRAPLRVGGEWAYAVPPLAVRRETRERPTPSLSSLVSRLSSLDSVRLFVERAQGVRPDFALTEANAPAIGAICAHLNGLPLALELAAANVRMLPPTALLAQLAQRLPLLEMGPRDAPDRQRTMRAAIAWSYDLLAPDEQALFRRLSVFVGGFTLEGAQAASPERSDTLSLLDSLAELIDHSLVQAADEPVDEPCYAMLETIREFGLERLVASGDESAVRRGHASYFLALAEAIEPNLFGPAQARSLATLERELGNLRAALAWFAERDAVAENLRLASALTFLWVTGLRFAEGRRWLEHGLDRADAVAIGGRAKAMICAGFLAHYRGDEVAAIEHLDAGLTLARAGGESYELGFGCFARGIVAEDTGDYDQAVPLLTEAVAHFRAIDRPAFAELARFHLGVVRFGRGDLAEAAAQIAAALHRLRELDCHVTVAATSDFLGLVALADGQVDDASTRFREALALTAALRTPEGIVRGLAGVATLAATRGEPAVAARLFGAGAAAGEASGYAVALPERAVYDASVASVRAALGEHEFAGCWERGRATTVEDAIDQAIAWLDQPRRERTVAESDGASPLDRFGLSPRERDVLRLVAAGHPNRAIAEALSLSPATVKRHVTNILAKLDVTSRAEAISLALRSGLIDDGANR